MKRNIFRYTGKATRTEFWTICICCIASLFVAGPVIDSIDNPGKTAVIILYALLFIRTLSAVAARRCHDLGLSGWSQFNPRYYLRIPFGKSIEP